MNLKEVIDYRRQICEKIYELSFLLDNKIESQIKVILNQYHLNLTESGYCFDLRQSDYDFLIEATLMLDKIVSVRYTSMQGVEILLESGHVTCLDRLTLIDKTNLLYQLTCLDKSSIHPI